jgi:Rad3-related DNA helicase
MARDPEWYHMEAVKCFVQTCGRGMRAKDDTCVTYAIDSDISRLIHSTKRDLPSWFLEAIDDR